MGFGVHIDSEQLKQLEHLRLPDVLRRRTSVRLVSSLRGDGTSGSPMAPVYAVSTRRPGPSGTLLCPLDVWLDGIKLPNPTNLNTIVGVSQLEAVEVYYGAAGIPAEFSGAGSTACGVIVLWSRRP